jgi:dihydroorotase
MKFELPKWYDLHVHFRQGNSVNNPMGDYIKAHLDMGCAGVLAMPNTQPPVARVSGDNTDTYWTIENYLNDIQSAGGNAFDDIIVPLYLTPDTTPDMIIEGAKSGLLRSAKYYPPHGTTNSEHGAGLETYMNNGVFEAMADTGVILNIHGEEHDLSGENYFGQESNAEDYFYSKRMPALVKKIPNLKIVCEHITTKTACDFVLNTGDNVAATITPQHLMFTVADLLQGLKYHLYCLPLVKFEKDRQALLSVAKSGNAKLFAGTDSAPHTTKCTPCGCAAGCFTGGIAPQLYAMGFDLCEENFEAFKKFLCTNGSEFYGLEISNETFTLEKKSSSPDVKSDATPLHKGLGIELDWTLSL